MTVDRASWENIPHNTAGYADEARSRLFYVLDNDPFVRMFGFETRACMVDVFMMALRSPAHAKVDGGVSAYNYKSMVRDLNRVVKFMPLGFTTAEFREHLVSLVVFAVRPRADEGEYYENRVN